MFTTIFTKGRNRQIDALRGLAIVLVILGHAIIVYPINLHEIGWCMNLYKWIYSVHMPLFFFLSGYCYHYKGDYAAYIIKKMKHLVLPYFLFGILDMLSRACFSQLVNRNQSVQRSVINMFLYGGEYWFLYVLFLIFLIFPFLEFLENHIVRGKIFLLAGFMILKIIETDFNILCINLIFSYLFFFYLGHIMKAHLFKDNKDMDKGMIYYRITGVITAVTWLFLVFGNLSVVAANFLTPCVGIVCCYCFSKEKWFIKVFSPIGIYSLPLYLLNGFTLTISRAFLVYVIRMTNPACIILFNVMIDLVFTYWLLQFFMKRSKLVRCIFGMGDSII